MYPSDLKKRTMTQPPLRLLAKSSANENLPRPEETLPGHTEQVLLAAERILSERGSSGLRALRLPPNFFDRLRSIVLLAGFIHDLGKASEHYQQMVRGRRRVPQLIRHEALSLWLCWPGQVLAPWLSKAVSSIDDYKLAVIAAAGHHRKFLNNAFAPPDAGAGDRVTIFASHSDFAETLALAVRWFKVPPVPDVQDQIFCTGRGHFPEHSFQDWEKEIDEWLEEQPGDRQLLAAAKAFVISADVAGSCLAPANKRITWIKEHLAGSRPSLFLEKIVSHHLRGKPLRPFQEQVAASSAPTTLVTAGCGTGKTLAAYLWGLRRHPERQLWIAYPTTGTASEGFRDYIWEADVDGLLEHSRAEIDLELLSREEGEESGQRALDRLKAIRAWGTPLVACTADTIIGLLQNQRKGLYAWPALCNAAVVFDEIHAYDRTLFSLLLRFLQALPELPVLLMTATLPAARLRALADLVERVHGRPLCRIEGPQELEELLRYSRLSSRDPWTNVLACLEEGGKVLWVVNTVDRCIEIANQADQRGLNPLVYHSRFRYLDRVARHREVVDAFEASRSHPTLAVTTQVAEMSLNLSADLLVTELAPVWALIQRLGRLNRRAIPGMAPKPFLVITPPGAAPYTEEELAEAADWLNALPDRPLSQRDLVEHWAQRDDVSLKPARSEWLDGGFSTIPAPVRQASPGLDVVLAEDAPAIREKPQRVRELAIPMPPPPFPLSEEWTQWPRAASWYPVPPQGRISYDAKRGALWLRVAH